MENMNEKLNIEGMSTVTIETNNSPASVQPKKKRMNKTKKVALIASLSAAAAAVIIIPPVCVSQCSTSWNDYFEKPELSMMEQTTEYLASPVTYKLILKEQVPLKEEILVSIKSKTRTESTNVILVENSVTCNKNILTFQVKLDVRNNTSSNEMKDLWSYFDVQVSQVKIQKPQTIVWTTTMTGFKLSFATDAPSTPDISHAPGQISFDALGDEEHDAEVIIPGFTTNINPSCLYVEMISEGGHLFCDYNLSIEPINLTSFNVKVKISGIDTGTYEIARFKLKFYSKLESKFSKELPTSYNINTRYNFFVKLDAKAPTKYVANVDHSTIKQIQVGPFYTNTSLIWLNTNLDFASKEKTMPKVEYIGHVGTKDSFYVVINVSEPVIEGTKLYDMKLTFNDTEHVGSTIDPIYFQLEINYDFYMDRDAYAINGKQTYWFSNLIGNEEQSPEDMGSFICDKTGEHDIVADSINGATPMTWKRSDFNLPIHFNPKKINKIPDNFLKNCTSYNQTIELNSDDENEPVSIESIGNNFLQGCTSYNRNLVLNYQDTKLTTLGDNFMDGCVAFNNGALANEESPLILPATLTSIGDNFLNIPADAKKDTIKFNQEVDAHFANSLKYIGDNFLKNEIAFNHVVNLPNSVVTIGKSFMENCSSFNQDFKLPSSLKWSDTIKGNVPGLGNKFMFNCDNMKSTIDFQTLAPNSFLPLAEDTKGILSSNNKSSLLVSEGVSFEGINKKLFVESHLPSYGEEGVLFEDKTIWRTTKFVAPYVYLDSKVDKRYYADAEGKSLFEYDINGFRTNIPADWLSIKLENFHCEGSEEAIDSRDISVKFVKQIDSTLLNVKIIISKLSELKDDAKITFDLKFSDGTYSETITGFSATIRFDFWKKASAIIVDKSSTTPEYYRVSTLMGSGICTSDNQIPIHVGDKAWSRQSFNCEIWLNPKLTEIPEHFLSGCTSFNNGTQENEEEGEPLYLPESLVEIHENFLRNCKSFNHDIVLPSSLKKINANGLLFNTDDMQSTIDLGTLDSNVFITGTVENNVTSFSTTNKSATMYLKGIKFKGENKEALKFIVETMFKSGTFTTTSGTIYYRNTDYA